MLNISIFGGGGEVEFFLGGQNLVCIHICNSFLRNNYLKLQRTLHKQRFFYYFFNRNFSNLFECQNNRKRLNKSFAKKNFLLSALSLLMQRWNLQCCKTNQICRNAHSIAKHQVWPSKSSKRTQIWTGSILGGVVWFVGIRLNQRYLNQQAMFQGRANNPSMPRSMPVDSRNQTVDCRHQTVCRICRKHDWNCSRN